MRVFLLAFVMFFAGITTVKADSHGTRMQLLSPTLEIIVSVIIRTRPTYQENHAECIADGEYLLVSWPDHSYTCNPEG